ncbi:hypothetical protein TELCIR_06270 [Teladorsagia circumcincta]|uniref:Uncharacterized protein n=1 Tax=Teladorsagia circumcincta TaxID=45464 RepID=A0A2G9UNH1_TELCI|nr:hypothetical protein TELCIR_06270 [Teladorsagia circumcincta]
MLFDLSLWQMYSVAGLMGVTQSILLVTSLSITADLINRNTSHAAASCVQNLLPDDHGVRSCWMSLSSTHDPFVAYTIPNWSKEEKSAE